jgi:hypothetical protein
MEPYYYFVPRANHTKTNGDLNQDPILTVKFNIWERILQSCIRNLGNKKNAMMGVKSYNNRYTLKIYILLLYAVPNICLFGGLPKYSRWLPLSYNQTLVGTD